MTTPTTPFATPNAARAKDIALKVFWTAVFTGFGAATVLIADLDPAWIPVASAAYNAVGAWLRQTAGGYAPPSAEEVQSATVSNAITAVR